MGVICPSGGDPVCLLGDNILYRLVKEALQFLIRRNADFSLIWIETCLAAAAPAIEGLDATSDVDSANVGAAQRFCCDVRLRVSAQDDPAPVGIGEQPLSPK